MTEAGAPADSATDRDVVVAGGGPAGATAGLFTARYDLDTLVFDRGRSSLRHCAHLRNYPGFPGGIDVETFYDLLHDQAERAGCALVDDLVETVDHRDGGPGFRVETADGRTVTATHVVAATRYGGDYLRPLVGDDGFETVDHGDNSHERFRRDYADHDGTTPLDGLFVASPSHEADRQAVVAAGRGARTALSVVAAVRRESGLRGDLARHYDWVRREPGEDAWDRDRWREWFDDRLADDADVSEDRRRDLRERTIDRRLATYRTDEEIAAAAEAAHDRLLDHVDDDLILDRARRIQAERSATEGGD